MAAFPDLCPVSRSFTAPEFPTKRFESISGAGTTRLYGSKATNAKLRLQFVVNDADAADIFDCWYGGLGEFSEVALPDNVYEGQNSLLDRIQTDYLKWFWENPPEMTTLQPGLSRINVNLIAYLEL